MSLVRDKGVSQYWNEFYASHSAGLKRPSQFATFILGEVDDQSLIFDVGCGTGKDTLFFASHGHHVVGVDGSDEAVNFCNENANSLSLDAQFFCSSVQNLASSSVLEGSTALSTASSLIVYARFFLHAIPEEDEDALLEWVKTVSEVTSRPVKFAAEFRTHRDATLPKSTSQHYRRFVNPADFMSKSIRNGFNVDYFVEGFGFAKYKNDDAHVARCIISI